MGTRIKDYVTAVIVIVLTFAAAYFFMSIRMEMCPLFTTCIQVR